ncbi:MAG: hypothetical protein ABI333_19615 [bacterium]
MLRSVIALALGCTLLAFGCGRGADPYHPRTALQQYIRYVQTNNSKGAYELLSKKLRQGLSYPAFARKWTKNYAELQVQASDIGQQLRLAKQFEIDAKLRFGQRRTISLKHEGSSWKIVGGVSGGFDSMTPRQAVMALVRALEARNFSAFLRLLSKPRREKLVQELTLRLEKLKANLDRDIEVTGNRARLQYDPRYWIMLIKENGAWKVIEFN